MIALLAIGWMLGALTVWAFVWAGARRERLAAEEADRRIEAADEAHREHMRALREHEDEQFWVACRMNDELAGFGSAP